MHGGPEKAIQIQEQATALASHLRGQEWGKYKKNEFENACDFTLAELKKIRSEIVNLQKHGEFETWSVQSEIAEKNGEYSKFIELLEKNLELEKKKSQNKLAEFDLVPSEQKHNEQFSRLQFDTSNLLLKTNYVMEKLLLETKKMSVPKNGPKTSTSQALMELLKSREEELHHTKQRFSQMRIQALTGQGAEQSPADLEKDLQQTAQKIAVQQHKLSETISHYKKLSEETFNSQSVLGHEIAKMSQLLWNHFDQNIELVTLLKKERDTARQLALETESETVGLRSKYSNEILGFQGKIVEAQMSAKRESEAKIAHLQKEAAHKTETVESLTGMLRKQQQQLEEMASQNHALRLRLITYAKHDTAKKALLKPEHKK